MFKRLLVVLLLLSLTLTPAIAQQDQQEKPAKPAKVKAEDVDAEAEQRQEVAMALVVTLADEARSFKDQTRRARVQARAADILWERDQERRTAEDFDLLGLFRLLARADLLRAVQLTKSFTGYVPRAVATLAIAQSVLEKRKDRV